MIRFIDITRLLYNNGKYLARDLMTGVILGIVLTDCTTIKIISRIVIFRFEPIRPTYRFIH